MSDTENKKPDVAAAAPGPETQRERWMKYGANVALVSVVVILLGVLLIAISDLSWAKANVDTTQAGLYSLKPQTKAVLKDLKQNVKIVSLYTVTKPQKGKEKEFVDYATPVADLLEEYQRYGGGKVEVEVIDPTENPGKVDALIEDVTQRYGGEVKQYRDFIESFDKDHREALKKLATDEATVISELDRASLETSDLGAYVGQARESLSTLVRRLDDLKRKKETMLADKPPDYKGVASEIEKIADALSRVATAYPNQFKELANDKAAPEPVTKYAADSALRYAEIKKQADAVVSQVKKLGELKLDDLSQTLQARDSIVVLGPKDMRVIARDQVWQMDPNVRRMVEQLAAGGEPKERFAGEQQITSAILALTQETKPKVAIVRAGGPPMAQPGGLMGRSGIFAQAVGRLHEYNFDVVEKDLSGMWAMQSQMQGMPAAPEPSDADIKDAIWIVLATPPQQGGPMGAPPSIASKVAEHLKAGGAAMILMTPQGEDMSPALADFGIKVRPDAIIVHEPVAAGDGTTGDMINEAQKQPYLFILNEYGKHMLAEPVRSLDMPMIAAVPVVTTPQQGVTQWNLLPPPGDWRIWGETNIEGIGEGNVSFDSAVDVASPVFGGAAAEKQGGGRVVVYGSFESFTNNILSFPDMELLRRRVFASRFPGAGELFTNSMFWLAKMEPMIAISPAAMEVSRIEPMSKGMQRFWGVVLVGGLPLLVVVAGGLMYVRRRD